MNTRKFAIATSGGALGELHRRTDQPLEVILARGKVRPFIAVLAADLRSQASPPWSSESSGQAYAYNSSTNDARLASSA